VLGGSQGGGGGRGLGSTNNSLPLATPSCSATSSSSSMDTSSSVMEVKKERSSIFGMGGQQGYRLGGSPSVGVPLGSLPASATTSLPTTIPVGRGNHPLLALWESRKKSSEEPTRAPSPPTSDDDDDDVIFLDKTMCQFCGERVVGDLDSHIDICCPLEGPDGPGRSGFSNFSNNLITNNGFGGSHVKSEIFNGLNGKRKGDEDGEVGRKKRKTEEMVLECPICGSGFESPAAVDVHIDECTTNSAMFS